MTLTKIALIGANGTLGPSILSALLSAGTFTVTVLSRQSSKSTYPPSVHVTHLPDDLPTASLLQALRGQDALVVAFAGSESDLQIRLADAAAEVGVKRFIPADFGSCDSSSPMALELVPLYPAKKKVREHLQLLAGRSGLSWTSLVCGHFFDYGLRSGLLRFDVQEGRAMVFDGGEGRWSATTLATVATAVVRVLEKEEETRNRMLYVQSFCVSQNQVLRVLERVTGGKWQVEEIKSGEYIEEVKKEMEARPDSAEAVEDMVSVVGIVDANWEGKDDFANELLGLKGEDLEEVVRKALRD